MSSLGLLICTSIRFQAILFWKKNRSEGHPFKLKSSKKLCFFQLKIWGADIWEIACSLS